MSHERSHTLTLRSSLKPALKQSALYRGTLLAFPGICLLLFGGIFLKETSLALWGFPLMGAGLALITAGLLPYRRLTRLETVPHELLLISDMGVRYSQNRKPCFTIPWSSIAKTAYLDHPDHYGIAIWLERPISRHCTILNSASLDATFKIVQSRDRCDVFLPYFSKRSYQDMLDFF